MPQTNTTHANSTTHRRALRNDAITRCLAALTVIIAGFTAPPVLAESAKTAKVLELGKAEFEYHCVVCHGASATGDGEMGKVLVKPPANLTQLSKANDGRFPFWRVYAIIGGEASVQGHQPFEMPGFWRRFRAEEQDSLLPAEMRILVLTHYLESLQE